MAILLELAGSTGRAQEITLKVTGRYQNLSISHFWGNNIEVKNLEVYPMESIWF